MVRSSGHGIHGISSNLSIHSLFRSIWISNRITNFASMTTLTEIETEKSPAAAESPDVAIAGMTVTTIRPASGWQFINARELWRFRELLYFLTWRDVKVRYKQT